MVIFATELDAEGMGIMDHGMIGKKIIQSKETPSRTLSGIDPWTSFSSKIP